jgi:hypothetical protein
MPEETMELVRVNGELKASLTGVGITTRGVPFKIPRERGEALLLDKTGRWARPNAPEAVEAAASTEAMLAAALAAEAKEPAKAPEAPGGEA